jgi:large subunit ribosomal protein L17
MFRNMVTSLFEHERIVTTSEKAKELRPIAEKMITLAKRGDLHARRQALSFIRSKDVVDKLFTDIKDKFSDRKGGYTRILKTGVRKGDAASMAIIELVGYEEVIEAPKTEN